MLQCVHLLFKHHIYVIHTIHTYLYTYILTNTGQKSSILSGMDLSNMSSPKITSNNLKYPYLVYIYTYVCMYLCIYMHSTRIIS